eukprot:Em0001g393a
MPRITKLGLLDLFIAGGNALTSLQLNISPIWNSANCKTIDDSPQCREWVSAGLMHRESQQIQACCDAHHVLHSEAVPSLGRVLYPPPTANSLGRQGWIASAARYKKIERSGTRQNMECLTCTYQRSITIPEGGVNAIAQNLRIRFEAEVVEYMSKIGTYDEKSCDACIDGSTGPAVAFCGTCRHLLCKHCHDHLKHGLQTVYGKLSKDMRRLVAFSLYCWPSPYTVDLLPILLAILLALLSVILLALLSVDMRTYWYRPAHPVGVAKATPITIIKHGGDIAKLTLLG